MARRTAPPRYVAIEQELRRQVSGAEPGDPLPSEAELCGRFGVSRMTTRQAVGQLERDGLVYRVPGRGTFVAQRRIHRRMGRLLSFTDEMALRGVRPSSLILDAALVDGSLDDVTALHLAPGTRVVVVRRVRLADGVPIALERAVVVPSCAGVLDVDLAAGSLHAALVERGRVPTVARGTLVAQPATDADSTLLDVPAGAPLLVERRVVHDQDDHPVECTETRYVGERYVFDIELLSAALPTER